MENDLAVPLAATAVPVDDALPPDRYLNQRTRGWLDFNSRCWHWPRTPDAAERAKFDLAQPRRVLQVRVAGPSAATR